MKKETVMRALEDLPHEFDAEELFERLILIEKIEEGRQQAEQGLGNSLEEVEAMFQRKWSNWN